jgi:rod shape-determining protein MreC
LTGKKVGVALALIVTIALMVFMGVSYALFQDTSVPGANFLNGALAPFQKMFTAAGNSVGGFFSFVSDMKKYEAENRELSKKVDELENKLRESETLRRDVQTYREMLELRDRSADRKIVACQVIANESGNWFRAFKIDKGELAGVRRNDAVVTTKGLAGVVTQVGLNWAMVTSIIDSQISVGALVTRTHDVVVASGDLQLSGEGRCRLLYVTRDASVVVGDTVETSGLGGVYPKGILIGTVTEVSKDETGVGQRALLDTAVDFERVYEVMVISALSPEE